MGVRVAIVVLVVALSAFVLALAFGALHFEHTGQPIVVPYLGKLRPGPSPLPAPEAPATLTPGALPTPILPVAPVGPRVPAINPPSLTLL